MSLSKTLFLAILTLVLWSGYLIDAADGRRLLPDRKEIIIRQLDNGYMVEAHTRNNPYPYREAIFTDPVAAGVAVSGLLRERIPGPIWGK